MRTEADIGEMQPQAKERLERETLEETMKHPPQELLEGAWPCQHLDLGALASRTVRESISVVLSQ